jgi:hypothetical protein
MSLYISLLSYKIPPILFYPLFILTFIIPDHSWLSWLSFLTSQAMVIPKSLTDLSRENNKLALQIHKDLLGYMGDKQVSTYMHTNIYTHLCIYIHIPTNILTYSYIYIFILIYPPTRPKTYTYIHIHTNITYSQHTATFPGHAGTRHPPEGLRIQAHPRRDIYADHQTAVQQRPSGVRWVYIYIHIHIYIHIYTYTYTYSY